MLDLRLDVRPNTAQRLKKVIELAPDSETFAQNIIAYQIAELKHGRNLRLDLMGFEEKYQLSTPDFYSEFSQGKTDDREDYMVWAGLYEMLNKNEEQLQGLE